MRFGGLKARRLDPVVLLVVATALLLPVLGFLQYRWLERWSDSELGRMHSTLIAGVFLLGEEVDRAVAAAAQTFDVSSAAPGERLAALEAGLATWRARAPYPELIGAVELVERGGPSGGLRRRSVGPALPGAAAPPLPDLSAGTGARLECGDAGAGRPAWLVLPLDDGRSPAWVVAALDEGYLTERLLPRLLSFFFTGRDPSAEVLATVGEHADGGRILAAYPVGRPRRPLESVDAGYNFLSLRIRGWLSLDEAVQAAPEDREREPPGCWTIQVAHQSGSIEAAVATLRRRQTAASFGVLALLALTSGALAVAARRAARLGRQQLAFVAGVTHELRTPLSVIRTAGDNLAKRVVADAEGVAEYGRLIRAEGRRLSEMVENVLRLSRVGYGLGDRAREPVEVADAIAAAVAECRALCEEHGVEVVVQARTGRAEPVVLPGDRDALVCALRNLLANAVKHGPPGQTVRVETSGDGATLAIAVTDQGEGIPESERDRVFEAFYRGESARSRGVQGAGLGLALVRQVAELHGGTVKIDGPTVALVLPVAPGARADRPLPRPTEEAGDA